MQAPTTNPYLGVGLYSVQSAAHYLSVSPLKVRRWAEGYLFIKGKELRNSPPVKGAESPELAAHRLISFQGFVELMVINHLRQAGVSMNTIRFASAVLSERLRVAHPFAVERLFTDGVRIFRDLTREKAAGRSTLEEIGKSQFVIRDTVEPYFKRMDYTDEIASRYWPLGRNRGVRLDPEINFGAPVVCSRAVPTYVLAAMVEGGSSTERVAWWYDIPLAAVEAAVEYEKGLKA